MQTNLHNRILLYLYEQAPNKIPIDIREQFKGENLEVIYQLQKKGYVLLSQTSNPEKSIRITDKGILYVKALKVKLKSHSDINWTLILEILGIIGIIGIIWGIIKAFVL